MKIAWKKFPLFIAVLSIIFSGFLFAQPANAQSSISTQYTDIQNQGLIFAGICTSSAASCPCRDTGNCTLNDIMQVLVNLSVFILAISGSVMLLMFVYGGFCWLTAHGDSKGVTKGRDTIVGALIGLVIIFGAYAVINIVISVLQTGDLPEQGQNIEDTIDNNSVIKTE